VGVKDSNCTAAGKVRAIESGKFGKDGDRRE
jgi:hypothetical protein